MRRTKSSFLGSDLFYSSHPNLRIFQKIKMSNPEIKREKQSLVNRGSLLTPEQKQLQKLTLKLHRERYGFHDSLVVPNQMYLIRRELKSNGEKSDPKSVAVRWRNLTTEERKVINEKNLDEKNYYFEQNRIAIKTVLLWGSKLIICFVYLKFSSTVEFLNSDFKRSRLNFWHNSDIKIILFYSAL
jgi:hypothetical protein